MKKEVRIQSIITLPNGKEYSKGFRVDIKLLREKNSELIAKVSKDMWRGAWIILMVLYEKESYLKKFGYLNNDGSINRNCVLPEIIDILEQRGYK